MMSNDGRLGGMPCNDGLPQYQPVEVPLKPAMQTGVALTAAEAAFSLCIPCKPKLATFMPVQQTPARNSDVYIKNFVPSSPPPVGNRGSTNTGPIISAGDGGGRRPPSGGGNGIRSTPQDLRSNPERQSKVKTEMCHYWEEAKKCPYGSNCNYAHGKHELKFQYTTLCRMESCGQIANAMTHLARPCMTWVSTGACPYGRRCAAIHDLSTAACSEYHAWLPAAVSNTNTRIIVDRLAAHRENAIHQENPLIVQTIWENCCPSRHGLQINNGGGGTVDNASKSILEWSDTYALVCNIGIPVFTGGIVPAPGPFEKLSALQKLCIVRCMRTKDGLSDQEFGSQLHRDYVFTPTHSLHSELCMILQSRYFFLPDVNFVSVDGVSHIVEEISFEEYEFCSARWSANQSKYISAHEVAFAPKGDHSANVSIWFDATPIQLAQSQIKRNRRLKQKKKAQIRNEHTGPNANGALINRTSVADFPTIPPAIEPFVPMLPAEDNQDSLNLINHMIDHRIDSLILKNCSSVDDEQKKQLNHRMKELQTTFMGMIKFQEKWTLPKREGMGNLTITSKAPRGNVMPYIPLKTNKKSPCIHIWDNFANNIGNTCANTNNHTKRLSVFLSLDGSLPRANKERDAKLPHILSNKNGNLNTTTRSPKKDGTWKEILLGLPENGQWEAALRLHNNNENMFKDIKAQYMPLTSLPFE